MADQVPIADIVIGERHRRDLGDVAALAKSICDVGLLQPIVITPDRRLIAGERRIAAFRHLGQPAIPAVVIDLDEIVRGEWAENAERKPFTPSEAVAIGRAIEERERIRARERQIASQANPGEQVGAEKLAPPIAEGRTRDIVGAALGMSGATYEAAKAVVAAAEADPETFAAVKQEMDRTGKVHPAYERVRKARAGEPLPPANNRTADAVARRDERIRSMADEGYRPSAIAQATGLGEMTVRAKLNEWGIASVEQKVGKRRRVNPNDVLSSIIDNAIPPEEAVAAVLADWHALDRARFSEWMAGLDKATRSLAKLRSLLRKESEGDSSNG